MKYVLIDIDGTFISTEHDDPLIFRPNAIDFLQYLISIGIKPLFYTAANHLWLEHVVLSMIDCGVPFDIAESIYRGSLSRDNCPMIEMRCVDNARKNVITLPVKCLDSAAKKIGCDISDILFLIDDNPDMGYWQQYPEKYIRCPSYYGQEDIFFLKLIEHHKMKGILKM